MIGRKNFYGSGAEWAAHLAADVWTVTATAARHDIEPLGLLTGYLHECARNGGAAPAGADLDPFLSWTPEDAPAVVPPAIPAPARNPGQSAARQSRTTPLRHMTPRAAPPCPPTPKHNLPRVSRSRQPVQCDIQQQRRNSTALGSSLPGRREPFPGLENPCLKPPGDHPLRRETADHLQQMLVADLVECACQVRVKNPHPPGLPRRVLKSDSIASWQPNPPQCQRL